MVDNTRRVTNVPLEDRAGSGNGNRPERPTPAAGASSSTASDASAAHQYSESTSVAGPAARNPVAQESDGITPGWWIVGLLFNPLSLLGLFIAIGSAFLDAVFLAIQLGAEHPNPYAAIIGFMILPGGLVLGMAMVPIGALLRRHKLRRQAGTGRSVLPAFPVIDLNQRAQLRLAMLALAGGLVATGLVGTASVKGFEFSESADFCGTVCHRVMTPEYVAYQSSTHARVPCASCHIGPGASWFVKSKLTGIGQLVAYTLNTYPRPVPAPIESLRPSRETCEQCHWPDRIYGDRLQIRKSYAADDRNSLQEKTMVFRVGGGSQSAGVHWHITNEVWYLATDQARENIVWVEVRRPDGSREEYRDPVDGVAVTTQQIEAGKRHMDCVDCHNRAAHEIIPYDEAVDRALANNTLDASIPHLKQLALALGPKDPVRTLSEGFETVKARLATFAEAYRQKYPQLFEQRREAILATGERLVKIYSDTAFPAMGTDAGTYTNNMGHQLEGTGCARCHGKLASINQGQIGEKISSRCDLCHYAPVTTLTGTSSGASALAPQPASSANYPVLPPVSENKEAADQALFGKQQSERSPSAPRPVPHAFDANKKECLACHGRGGTKPVPVSHAGRTDDTCLLCHQPGAAASTGQSVDSSVASP